MVSSSSETGPRACRSADTPQDKATHTLGYFRRSKARRWRGVIDPHLLGAGKAAPDIGPSLGPCPQLKRDMEKSKATKMVRARSSTGNSPALIWGLD